MIHSKVHSFVIYNAKKNNMKSIKEYMNNRSQNQLKDPGLDTVFNTILNSTPNTIQDTHLTSISYIRSNSTNLQ